MENFESARFNFGEQREAAREKNEATCKYCGATLEDEQLFCPECGQKVGGEEHVCPVCKYTSTTEYCPHCGYKIIPTICPSCGAECHFDFCESCGEIIGENLKKQLEAEEEPIRQTTAEEVEEIKKIFEKFENKDSRSQSEKERFLEKIKEHQILLEEREYFNQREKRIIKVFGKSPIEFSVPDEKEQAFIIKAYASLDKIVTERETKAKKEMFEEIFKAFEEKERIAKEKREEQERIERVKREEQERLEQEERERIAHEEELKAEEERQRLLKEKQEMEEKYKALLANVSSEVEKAQLEEKKRLEEERRKREEEERKRREEERRLREIAEAAERKRREEERRKREAEEAERRALYEAREREQRAERAARLAEQEYENRKFLGTYILDTPRERIEICLHSISGTRVSGTVRTNSVSGRGYGSLSGSISGTNIYLKEYSYSTNIRGYLTSFQGYFNDTGHIITGSWGSSSDLYCKE